MDQKGQFGPRLKAAREARGISLRDIADTTKISVTALEALEHNDASRLPGGIFSRAFVRAYAREVGIDAEAAVREFAEQFPDAVQPLRDVAVIAPAHEPSSGGSSWWRGLAVGLVLLLALGAGVVMMGWTDGWLEAAPSAEPMPPVAAAPPQVAIPEPLREPGPAVGAPAGAGDVAAAPGAPVEANGPAEPPVADVSRLVALDDHEPMRLAIRPIARCWVRVVADGRVVLARELAPGERAEHNAAGEIVLTVGDAGAFTYSINDVPGRALGAPGKVVTIRIRRSNLTDFVAS